MGVETSSSARGTLSQFYTALCVLSRHEEEKSRRRHATEVHARLWKRKPSCYLSSQVLFVLRIGGGGEMPITGRWVSVQAQRKLSGNCVKMQKESFDGI